MARNRPRGWKDEDAVAGNGLLHRRVFLTGGAAVAVALTGYTVGESLAAQQLTAEQLIDAPWSATAGSLLTDYGVPSRFEKNVGRTLSNPKGETRTSHARTPHHLRRAASKIAHLSFR